MSGTLSFATKSRGLTSQQSVQQKGSISIEGELVKTKYDNGVLTISNSTSSASIFSVDFKDKSDIKVNADLDNLPHIRLPSEKGTKRKAEDKAEAEEPKKKKPKKDKEAPKKKEEEKEEVAAPKPKKERKKKDTVIGEVKMADVGELFTI